MENGKIIQKMPTTEEIRKIVAKNLSNLPEKYRKLTNAETYPVDLSQSLTDLITQLKKKITQNEVFNLKPN